MHFFQEKNPVKGFLFVACVCFTGIDTDQFV